MIKRIHINILFVLISYGISAQESMGIKSDNYLPSVQARLNPSSIAAQKPWIQIHLLGLEAYARNNLAYIPGAKITQLNSEIKEAYNYDPKKYSAYINAEVFGPMVSAAIGIHSIGVHTAVRTFGSVKNIPQNFSSFIDDDIASVNDIFNIENGRLEAMAWGEIGLTYATILEQNGNTMITGGVTLKKLMGYFNGGLYIKNALFEVNGDQGNLYDLNGAYSFVQPSRTAGKGWGTDLGVSFYRLRNEMGRYIPHSAKGGCLTHQYKYKIGLSLLDVGFINFTQDAQKGTLNETMTQEELEQISKENSDVISSNIEPFFKAVTPMALSAQFDYHINDEFYLNGTVIQKLNISRLVGAERDNLLSASVRYEKRGLGIGIPITLQNYRYPQIGISLRTGPLIIGSDHMIPFIIKSDIYAADIFFALQFSISKHPSCKQKGKNKKATYTGGSNAMPPCPEW